MNDNTQGTPEDVPQQRVLRTFEDDIADAMREGKGSALGIVLAEQKKREQVVEIAEEKKNSSLLLVIGIILLAAAIAIGGYFAYDRFGVFVLPDVEKGTAEFVHPLIKADSVKMDDIGKLFPKNSTGESFIYRLGGSKVSLNEVAVIVPTLSSGETTVPVDVRDVIPRISVYMPSILQRSIGDPFAIGIHSGETADLFMAFTITNYENAFSGMLEWEKFMSDDLYKLFGVTLPTQESLQNALQVATSSEAATSTQHNMERDIGVFVDRTIKNRDVRVIQDDNGEIYFMYGFINRKTLIITTTPETYFEVVNRLR